MYIDFKVTNWERVTIPKNMEERILTDIKNGILTSADDVLRIINEVGKYSDPVCDTSEQMYPKDNDGQATIEVWGEKENGNDVIWNNETKES